MPTTEDPRHICVTCGLPASLQDPAVMVDGRQVHARCVEEQDDDQQK